MEDKIEKSMPSETSILRSNKHGTFGLYLLLIFFQISNGENIVNPETLVIHISLHVEWSRKTFHHLPNVMQLFIIYGWMVVKNFQ